MTRNRTIGDTGENAAAQYLTERGFRILTRNYRKSFGEIDIVASKERAVHFVEVKTSGYHAGSAFLPEIRVDRRKRENLIKVCESYLREVKAPDAQEWQIDVISVILNPDGSVQSLAFFENAVFGR